MITEIWKDIPNYEGLYQASSLGNIRGLDRVNSYGRKIKGKLLRFGDNGSGYRMVVLNNSGRRSTCKVHQLVAMAFLGHMPCGFKLVVDHKNNVKNDNRLENLQLISARNNCSKDNKGGTSKHTGVGWHKASNKWRAYIHISGVKKHLGLFIDEEKAAKAYQEAVIELKDA